ncbi:hypothetical protein B0T16DRAFT_367034 [Cercophora newfieldiana]|uniref:Uncharacterized protein n=1 Tax=Cercophora newfieldiana TaxID=92897 RepID=A0AA40CUC5_9PEZI|nr:hypothetical protein B0T16DRAFT_367034 [Cercophora newfieldiana]
MEDSSECITPNSPQSEKAAELEGGECPPAKLLEATEVWGSKTSGTTRTKALFFTTQNLLNWLAEDLKNDVSTGEALVMRVITVPKFMEQPWKCVPSLPISQITDRLGLQFACDYTLSCVAGVADLSPCATNTDTDIYALAHPKLTAIWSVQRHHHTLRPQTQLVAIASLVEQSKLRDLLRQSWDFNLASHPMFPALLCGQIMSGAVSATQNSLLEKLRSVEVQTGHHNSKSLVRPEALPVRESWERLSARMSGHERKLASTARKIDTAMELQDFVLQRSGATHDGREMIQHQTRLLRTQLGMQRRQNEFLLQHVKIQLTAVRISFPTGFSLRPRGIQLIQTRTARQMASSMRTLALVSLLFLPGSFVAAVFSTPLFNWEATGDADSGYIGVRTKPQFKLFWLITIPLTTLAFVLYIGWSLFQERRSPGWRFRRSRNGHV